MAPIIVHNIQGCQQFLERFSSFFQGPFLCFQGPPSVFSIFFQMFGRSQGLDGNPVHLISLKFPAFVLFQGTKIGRKSFVIIFEKLNHRR